MFTVIVVCFNAGSNLEKTLNSIYSQDYWNYKVIIKDGGSTDGSLVSLKEAGCFTGRIGELTTIIEGSDKGIYDAMNIAVSNIDTHEDNYVIFMNCGDTFHDRQTLGFVADYISETDKSEAPYIFYGDQYNELTDTVVSSVPSINEFALFRNVPCHQVCFYDSRLFGERGYNTEYVVRADYEHFLYCCYEKNAVTVHMNHVICNYEGGGFSETKKNRERSAIEHAKITDYYMGDKAKRYRMIMTLSGAGLRTKLAESKTFSGAYNALKSIVYKIKS